MTMDLMSPVRIHNFKSSQIGCIIDVYNKIRKLKFSEDPDYDQYIKLIKNYLNGKECF